MNSQSVSIHPDAIIHPGSIIEKGAIVHAGVQIGPFCHIGSDVEIGERTVIKSHVVINGHTRIGCDNTIYPFASIGDANQDLKYRDEPTRVEIGHRNTIRESVTIHRGTIQEQGLTRIGNDNLLMVNVHIAHDCIINNHCILANNATLGGHVKLDDFAIIGGLVAVHQYCIIGAHVMVGGCSGVAQDVPPYLIAQGNHATPHGINTVGLKRRGFDQDALKAIRQAYKILYRSGKTLEEARPELDKLAQQQPVIQLFIDFLARSTRGIIR